MSDKEACREKKRPCPSPPRRVGGGTLFGAAGGEKKIGPHSNYRGFWPAEGRLIQIIEDFPAGGGFFF